MANRETVQTPHPPCVGWVGRVFGHSFRRAVGHRGEYCLRCAYTPRGMEPIPRTLDAWKLLVRFAPKARFDDLDEALREQGFVMDMVPAPTDDERNHG